MGAGQIYKSTYGKNVFLQEGAFQKGLVKFRCRASGKGIAVVVFCAGVGPGGYHI